MAFSMMSIKCNQMQVPSDGEKTRQMYSEMTDVLPEAKISWLCCSCDESCRCGCGNALALLRRSFKRPSSGMSIMRVSGQRLCHTFDEAGGEHRSIMSIMSITSIMSISGGPFRSRRGPPVLQTGEHHVNQRVSHLVTAPWLVSRSPPHLLHQLPLWPYGWPHLSRLEESIMSISGYSFRSRAPLGSRDFFLLPHLTKPEASIM